MNTKETLKLISTKTWCNINDLMKLTGLSRSSALKIRNKIKDTLNYEIHTRDLPQHLLVLLFITSAFSCRSYSSPEVLRRSCI